MARTGSFAWTVALAPAALLVWQVDAPAGVVLSATGAALACLALAAWLSHGLRVSVGAPTATLALVWGAAVAAPVAGFVNDGVQATAHPGAWFATGGAPVVEEAAKAGVAALLCARWWAGRPADVRTAIVAGAVVGVGFAWTENVRYLLLARLAEGAPGLVRATAVRGVLQGAVHPLFAATTAAGLALARAPDGRIRPGRAVAGFAGAIAQHVWWNGAAAPALGALLCNGVTPAGACRGAPDAVALLVYVPLVVAAALVPGIAGLTVLARRVDGPRPTPASDADVRPVGR